MYYIFQRKRTDAKRNPVGAVCNRAYAGANFGGIQIWQQILDLSDWR